MSKRLPSDKKPRRILSLDGGGVRGALTIGYLERIERLLQDQSQEAKVPRLCDHFDLIGGTSTGAIIATALALGYSASQIKDFYFHLGPKVFRNRRFRLWFVQTIFDARSLRKEISRIVGDRRLDSQDLQTFLAIVTKRMDTGSAWIVTNNPKGKYWDDPLDRSYIGNRHYRLADLVRASTAAPYYFTPHDIEIAAGEKPGLFIDGGVSPHNNPALALLQVAAIPAYGLGWQTGADALEITSIGTGMWRPRLSSEKARRLPAIGLAVQALTSVSADAEAQVLTIMQALGTSDTPWAINSEIGDLREVLLPPEPLFKFRRYDVRLEEAWLRDELGISLEPGGVSVEGLRMLDNASAIPQIYEIGRRSAELTVKPEHFASAHSA